MRTRIQGSIFLISTVGLLVSACAPPSSENYMLGEQAGERGTFVALGMDIDSENEGTLLTIGQDESGKVISGQTKDAAAPVQEGKKKSSTQKKSSDDFVLLKSDTKGVTIGTVFQGDEPLSKNESNTFIPASITKVVTSAIALKTLGADFRFTTRVAWHSDQAGVARDLTVIANGDPTVSRSDDPKGAARATLQEISKNLRSRGIKKLSGSLRVVPFDERRDVAIPAVGVDKEDNLQCFGAIAQNFNFNWNCASLTVFDFEKARWSDSSLSFPFELNMTRGEKNRLSATPQFDSIGRMAGVLVEGVWGTKEPKSYGISVPISNVKEWYARALLGELAKQGIDVKSVEVTSPTADEAIQIVKESRAEKETSFDIQSASLSEIMVPMNKRSDNFLADTFFKSVAEKHSSKSPDLRQSGALAVRENIQAWMTRNGHPDYASEIHLIDGSGLTRENRASPRAFLALMKEFAKEPGFIHLWESLPIAGRDGTLAGRMGESAAAGYVRAKTGTVRGAYQLAGYIPKLGAGQQVVEHIPFVILSAAGPGDKDRVRSFQDKLVARLMEVVNPSMKPVAKAQ